MGRVQAMIRTMGSHDVVARGIAVRSLFREPIPSTSSRYDFAPKYLHCYVHILDNVDFEYSACVPL